MNVTPSPARAALRRLIIILTVAVGLIIFAYGWSVTDINLEKPQEPLRQENVGNALRELLSPNVLEQEYDIQTTTISFMVECPADFQAPPAPAVETGKPYITVTPACASANDEVTLQGFNFYPDSLARINWITPDGQKRIRQVDSSKEDNFVTNDDGTFTVHIEVPRIRGSTGQTHSIEAQGAFPIGAPKITATTGQVLEKMVETIFLALIATVLSILPSAILSFFAAHNLMRPIRISLGNLLVTIALLPLGWWLGTLILGQIGLLAVNITKGAGFTLTAGASITLMFGAVTTSRKLQPTEVGLNGTRLRSAFNSLLFAVIVIAVIGLVGGLAISFGRIFQPVTASSESLDLGGSIQLFIANIPAKVSYFIGSVGQLIELVMPLFAGVIGAFALSSAGTSLTIDGLKRVSISMNYILGGVLGVICGAILLGFTALVGMQAAWLGLFTPLVAAMLGGQILPMIYRRATGKMKLLSNSDKATLATLNWVSAIIIFFVVFTSLNTGRAIIEGTLPGKTVAFEIGGLQIYRFIWQSMLIGGFLGGITGAMAGTKANFPIGDVMYNVTRTILNTLRSIEPLIMGLVFIIWVGIGPFAGVLALTLHSIASLGKLYSEQIESIDTGPIEALQSTGANRLQTIMYAVVPQIVPPYIAFTMYRWDINVRMSTIIGFVGGGGIGFLLYQQINLLRYRDAGVAVLAIAIIVSILDYASASIRERYI
ncbi:MAG: ABC transporter permease subunit [Chloroflexota bacterium]